MDFELHGGTGPLTPALPKDQLYLRILCYKKSMMQEWLHLCGTSDPLDLLFWDPDGRISSYLGCYTVWQKSAGRNL